MTDSQIIVQKLWNYCNILRDDGLSYGDYVEQLTFLLFLKMADERQQKAANKKRIVPERYDWQSLKNQPIDRLNEHYQRVLNELGHHPEDERLRVIFTAAQNKIQDPVKLHRLIHDLIDRERWTDLEADVKGDAYEGLLQKNAEDTKGGAGQYFTPRPLIQAIVDVMRPEPGMTICDPACGTGGFLLAAYNYVSNPNHYKLRPKNKKHLSEKALRGYELVDSVVRLALMNMFLHGIGGDDLPVRRRDSLAVEPEERFKMVLTNPPFGKSSFDPLQRRDFWKVTSNKQLNFL